VTKETPLDEPWTCHDCGKQQQLVTHNGKSFYSNSGWYWVQLHPGEKPVYLDMGCFNSYDQDWPDYEGTHETSAWRGGEWEGMWLWVLPSDYFARRDAYRILPRWEMAGDGWRLVTHDNRILGYLKGYTGDVRKKGMYEQLDADRNRLPDSEPMPFTYAKGAVHVYLGLGGPGMVQR
jgi:hypothetical protein